MHIVQFQIKWQPNLLCVAFFSKIQPGPVWTWVLSYASSVQGSTETWGPTCREFARWTLMICHESSRWCSVPLATTWSTVYGRHARWAAANQHLMLHGRDHNVRRWNIIDVLYCNTAVVKCFTVCRWELHTQKWCVCLSREKLLTRSWKCISLNIHHFCLLSLPVQWGAGIMDQGQIWAETVCGTVAPSHSWRGPRHHTIWPSSVGSDGAQPPKAAAPFGPLH